MVSKEEARVEIKKLIQKYDDLKLQGKIIPLEKQQPLIKLVDKMLSLNKKLNGVGDKKTDAVDNIKGEINEIDKEIDELVYNLYGITEDEKRIIEGALNG